MKAQTAIDKIKNKPSTFMGITTTGYAPAIEIREELCAMAERGEILPREYKKALVLTWPKMGPGEKRAEYEECS